MTLPGWAQAQKVCLRLPRLPTDMVENVNRFCIIVMALPKPMGFKPQPATHAVTTLVTGVARHANMIQKAGAAASNLV